MKCDYCLQKTKILQKTLIIPNTRGIRQAIVTAGLGFQRMLRGYLGKEKQTGQWTGTQKYVAKIAPIGMSIDAFDYSTALPVSQLINGIIFRDDFGMNTPGPIIIVEDDADDEAIFTEILSELNLPHKTIWFGNSGEAFNYLKTTSEQPFIIFSDVNLPGENGVEFKRRIDQDKQLREKSIPFVFYSTAVDQRIVNEVYTKMTVQGFFQKGNSYEEIKNHIKLIFDYWTVCSHPNMRKVAEKS